MECPLCHDYEGSHQSVSAHICGRHTSVHADYVGLRNDGEPLTRKEHERRKEEEDGYLDRLGDPDEIEAAKQANEDELAVPTETESNHDLGDLAVLGAGGAIYVGQSDITLDGMYRRLTGDSGRDTI